MKIKRGLALLGVLGLAALTLTGCGKNGANQEHAKDVTFLKDSKSSNQRIWYMVQWDTNDNNGTRLGETNTIDHILIVKNGKVTSYKTAISFKSINKKSDDQILKLAKKEDKDYFKWDLSAAKKEQERELYDLTGVNAKADAVAKKAKTEFKTDNANATYEAPTPHKITAQVETGNTSDVIASETLDAKERAFSGAGFNDDYSIYKAHYNTEAMPFVNYNTAFSTPVSVLDDMYTGYGVSNNDHGYYLLTKTTNKKTIAHFDTTKTKGVSIGDD